MNRGPGLIGIGAAFALLTIAQGCGSNSSQIPKPLPTPAEGPHVLTDLSTLSPANPLNPFGTKGLAVAQKITASGPSGTSGGAESTGSIKHIGDDKHPAELRFLNKKAADQSGLSERLAKQLFGEMEGLEDDDDIARLKLPTNLRPVVITGTLNKDGKLQELVVEQHSGQAAIDKMMIKACKKGIFIHNPPPEAMTPDGNYQVRVEARLENYASADGIFWVFKTYLGIGLL